MGNDSNPIKLAGTATTTFGDAYLYCISVNKALVGTLTINQNGTAIGSFAIGTNPGSYHVVPNGARYYKLTMVLSAADDVTVYTRSAGS